MTELEHAIKHIKTRADAWAVKEVTEALQSISERLDKALSQEPCRVKNELNVELNELKPCTDAVSREEVLNEFYDMENLYERIKQLPSVTPQPCDDAISRDAVLNLIEKGECLSNGAVMKLPSVTQKSKTGHWIKKEDDTCWWYVCSECEQEPLKNRWNDDDVLSTFCPNCGAKMVEPQESEEQTE